MVSLQEYPFSHILNTLEDDLIQDYFVPALSRSIKFDRGEGLFSSSWLRIAAKRMAEFANNGGRARRVTSPILNQDDWDALPTGVPISNRIKMEVILRSWKRMTSRLFSGSIFLNSLVMFSPTIGSPDILGKTRLFSSQLLPIHRIGVDI
jgi:hypothetical protein